MEEVDLGEEPAGGSPSSSERPIAEASIPSTTPLPDRVRQSSSEAEDNTEAGTPRLQPKLSSDSPSLPASAHHIELPSDTGSSNADSPHSFRESHLLAPTTDAAGEDMEAKSATDEDASPRSSVLEHEDLEAAEQRVVNGTVGGQLQPPSPYSVEGMRAASQRLAELQEDEARQHDLHDELPPGANSNAYADAALPPIRADGQDMGRQASSHMEHVQQSLDDFGLAPQRGLQDDPQEPHKLRGMLYHDGVDSLGRPVIVLNADAVGTNVSRQWACQYMLHRLEPIVSQGPYVLVMVNTGQGTKRLPAGWLISAYRNLSRPFKKNVKYIVLVRPSGVLKTMLAFVRPFVSGKANRKVLKVESLSGIASATNHEVTIQHLGARFAAAAGRYIADGMVPLAGTQPRNQAYRASEPFAMPSMSSPFASADLTERG